MTKYLPWGCSDPACGYRTAKLTWGTPYTICPLCRRARMTSDPPPQLQNTGRKIVTTSIKTGKTLSEITIRPHNQAFFDMHEREDGPSVS